MAKNGLINVFLVGSRPLAVILILKSLSGRNNASKFATSRFAIFSPPFEREKGPKKGRSDVIVMMMMMMPLHICFLEF